MKKTLGLMLGLLVFVLLVSRTATASAPMGKQYAEYYEVEKPKCTLCHVDKKTLNDYGKALEKELKGEKVITPAMFKAAESKRPK
ncbi:MAG: hypothetical protein IPJ04_09795 [Candidatus Eisenbacteria bacterium]|jgi:hypothetical protein|nr:hypothetical protein [Candidatus Eisenbacteria bacterium]